MRTSVKSLLVSVGLAGSLISASVLAEPFGLLNGRVANNANMSDMSVELGAMLGDVADAEYEHFGARLNYRLSPATFLYGDLGQTELGNNNFDGLAYGIGAFHTLEGVIEGSDFGVHVSYHRATLESGPFEADFTGITLGAVFSGQQPMGASDNMFWNANLGISRLKGETDSETELTFGGGVVVKNASGSGEFYIGALYVDDISFGGGYRHFLN